MESKINPKICCSIGNLRDFSIEELPFEGYEIRSIVKNLNLNIIRAMKIKEQFQEKDLSLHSQLNRIFSCNERGVPAFADAELHTLKSEIIISSIIGVKQINFHMKDSEFSEKEIKDFQKVLDFARAYGIEMVYENHVCTEDAVLRVLETFPQVNFCLDIGHLNLAISKGKFKMNMDEFLEKIRKRIVHIHAHNNYGEKDTHSALNNGNFDWKALLKNLENSNLKKIIIECSEKEDILETKDVLENYFNSS